LNSANDLYVSNASLLWSTLLLFSAVLVDMKQSLGLGKEIVVSGIRTVVQLVAIGYILGFLFDQNNVFLTLGMVLFIVFNAAWNAGKRSNGIPKAFQISFLALATGTTVTLTILVLTKLIAWTPSQIVPIAGMIVSKAMTALGIVYQTMNRMFIDQRQQILEKLSLGATPKEASFTVMRESIRTGMIPSIDWGKTAGIVSLPGMMAGLIFAGVDPMAAIRYQIVVIFMFIAVTSISCLIASYLAYRSFFNSRSQLVG